MSEIIIVIICEACLAPTAFLTRIFCSLLIRQLAMFSGLSDEEIQIYQEKGELMVLGHLLSGTDLKVKRIVKE